MDFIKDIKNGDYIRFTLKGKGEMLGIVNSCTYVTDKDSNEIISGSIKIDMLDGQTIEVATNEFEAIKNLKKEEFQSDIRKIVNTLLEHMGEGESDMTLEEAQKLIAELEAAAKVEAIARTAADNNLSEVATERDTAVIALKEANEALADSRVELDTASATLSERVDELRKIELARLGETRFRKIKELEANEAIDEDGTKAEEILSEMSEAEFGRTLRMAQAFKKTTDQTITNLPKSTEQRVTSESQDTEETVTAEDLENAADDETDTGEDTTLASVAGQDEGEDFKIAVAAMIERDRIEHND